MNPLPVLTQVSRICFHNRTLLHTLAGYGRKVGKAHDPVQGRGTRGG
jgi:hypothetical protein